MLEPVDQTKFGEPHGNCLMACVASLTGVPLDDLDDLYNAEQRTPDRHWWDVFNDALHRHGWHAIYLDLEAEPLVPRGYCIGSGLSPRGLMHAVVLKDGALAHDPHPSRAGVASIQRAYVLVPVLFHGDPATPTGSPTEAGGADAE